ncbi:hypothetical protein D3C72_1633810 [compost metagenome]
MSPPNCSASYSTQLTAVSGYSWSLSTTSAMASTYIPSCTSELLASGVMRRARIAQREPVGSSMRWERSYLVTFLRLTSDTSTCWYGPLSVDTSTAYSMRTPSTLPPESCACSCGQEKRRRTASSMELVMV